MFLFYVGQVANFCMTQQIFVRRFYWQTKRWPTLSIV